MDPNLPPSEPADRTPASSSPHGAARRDASPAELRATYFPEAPAKPSLVKMPPAMFRLLMIMMGFCLWFGAATIIQPRQSTATPGGRSGSSAVMPSHSGAAGQTTDRPWERRFAERADGWTGQEPGGMTPEDTAASRAARESSKDALAAFPVPPAKDAQGRKLLGSLVGSTWGVWIYSDAAGPLYTIVDPQGRIQAEGLTADEVYRQFPELPIDRLRLVPGTDALMLAEPMR